MKIKETNFKQNKIFFLLIGVGTLIDYISKLFIFKNFSEIKQVILTPFLNFSFVINKGVSFGFLNTLKDARTIISVIVGAIIIFLIIMLIREKNNLIKLSYSLITSGAIGNTIDRIIYGGVIDFLDFHYKEYHFPAFNIADTLIFIGCFLLIFGELCFKRLCLIKKNSVKKTSKLKI
jgi:signal peptidase II